jgi:hypothetical protein
MRTKDLSLLNKGGFNGKELLYSAEYARANSSQITTEHVEVVASDCSNHLLILTSYHKPE